MAAQYFARAVDAAPDNPFLLNRLGWLLATSPEDGVRNGSRAVEVAQRAVSVTARQDVMSLEDASVRAINAGADVLLCVRMTNQEGSCPPEYIGRIRDALLAARHRPCLP